MRYCDEYGRGNIFWKGDGYREDSTWKRRVSSVISTHHAPIYAENVARLTAAPSIGISARGVKVRGKHARIWARNEAVGDKLTVYRQPALRQTKATMATRRHEVTTHQSHTDLIGERYLWKARKNGVSAWKAAAGKAKQWDWTLQRKKIRRGRHRQLRRRELIRTLRRGLSWRDAPPNEHRHIRMRSPCCLLASRIGDIKVDASANAVIKETQCR